MLAPVRKKSQGKGKVTHLSENVDSGYSGYGSRNLSPSCVKKLLPPLGPGHQTQGGHQEAGGAPSPEARLPSDDLPDLALGTPPRLPLGGESCVSPGYRVAAIPGKGLGLVACKDFSVGEVTHNHGSRNVVHTGCAP